ncbi:TolC family protein [Dechloromonas sp. HYN0024]|uniref:TolC family protein n=1 Tax=Dechloromonas sp. HYN0024 TaxID=2231055 RepID=UPI000E43825A|nr:TolC family protein [Dechloromonas sp. HYN0024]AXS80324.1 TolC family protein [Dechloromonas sp. HYN0024]
MKLALGAALLITLFAGTARAEPLPGASVESLLAAARQHSPDLRMVRLEAEAARERIAPAGALPDPVLRIELENVTRNGSQNATLDPTRTGDTKYTLMQPLPFWGKRDLRREVASAEATQADGRTADTWAEVASRIKGLYAQYWLTGQSLQLTRENIELSRRLEQIAQVRYAGGLAAQQDAIRAQLERSTMEAELVGMESEFHHLMVFINAMLARHADAALAEPTVLRPLPPRLDGTALNTRLLAANPQLAIEAARIGGAEKSRDLAYRNRYPDLTLGVAPMQVGNRIDAWSLMLEMSLPLQQGTRRSQERESERLLEAAAARQEALSHRLQGDLNAAISNLESARATEQITRTRLLPQAELTFKSALAGYENGKVDFATLLDAQRQIRNTRLALLRAQASQQMRLADIERLLGEDL